MQEMEETLLSNAVLIMNILQQKFYGFQANQPQI